ncbi:hypothetical protein GIY62_14645 [Burkholderia plantarii]|uniref:hypothetical protein n=1 Tax=Burkholderia plantarii TaxID=41899 RepID=UPI00272C12BA|nr:hypothetical protein [Burkholderia plantarii]WLE58365.1 hypothetical protein GIY62_14645 [Burkholderia plantarii]
MRNDSTTEEPGASDIAPSGNRQQHDASASGLAALSAVTMSSLELVEFINAYRNELAVSAGQAFPSKGFAKLEHADFLKKVPEVLGACAGNFSATYQVPGPRGGTRSAACYRFPKREACLMAMSYSYDLQAKVFDRMTALELRVAAKPATPLSPAQMFLQTAQLMADIEARQFAQEAAVARVEQRLEDLSETRAFTSCPSNAEPITHIRKRIGDEYGLSSKVVDQVLRQSPYAPKPAGEVKNPHEDAHGSTYTVWWTKDVSAVFKRVAAEAVQVTDAQYTHPYIEGRFKVRGRKPADGSSSSNDLFEPESSP